MVAPGGPPALDGVNGAATCGRGAGDVTDFTR